MHDIALAETIRTYGRSIATVFPRQGQTGQSFAYTIGNVTAKKPELLILGVSGRAGGMLLNAISEILDVKDFAEGEKEIGYTFPCHLKRLSYWVVREYMGQAVHYHGTSSFEAMQVIIPDKQGRFPWQKNCDPHIRQMQEPKGNA